MKKIDDILGASRQFNPPRGLRLPPMTRLDWEHAVGARVAERTEPYRLERGVLYVRVASSAWANELAMLTEPIISQLCEQGVDVHTVRFAVGRVEAQQRTRGAPVRTPAQALSALPVELQEMVAHIETPALRHAITRAVLQNLAQHDPKRDVTSEGGQANERPQTQRQAIAGSVDRAKESPTPGPVSPSPPPVSVTRLSPPNRKP